jgi:hypothetical protein
MLINASDFGFFSDKRPAGRLTEWKSAKRFSD